MRPWLLLDYGDVISRPQDPDAVVGLARMLQLPQPQFGEAYWAHRPALDRGDLSSAAYWELVAGSQLDRGLVADLDEVDSGSWDHQDEAVLARVDELRAAGRRLALLSNAPLSVAARVRAGSWTHVFEQLHFSAEIRAVKPDAEAYTRTLEALGAPAADVTFVDDRPANIEAAAALGFEAVRFTGLASLASLG